MAREVAQVGQIKILIFEDRRSCSD
jgi:hypothetical protein